MAKIVVAGHADCPYYARAELLADNLQTNLPEFRVHKIVKSQAEWEGWLKGICNKNGWVHNKSPIVWRELIDRGGKGTLVGGCNEFQEYAWGYYGIKSEMLSNNMTQVASENLETHQIVTSEEEYKRSLSKPLNICITNASNPVAYNMVDELCQGQVLGLKTELSIRFLVQTGEEHTMEGLKMESFDLAYPLLRKAEVTSSAKEALQGCSLVIVLDDLSQRGDESWHDWIQRAGEVYSKYARVINESSRPDVKIIVGGDGPRNLGAYMMKHALPGLPRKNIVVPARLDENRAKAAIARRISVNSAGIVNVVIWGNVGGSTYTDITRARVHGCEGAIWGPPSYSRPVREMVHDEKWLQTEYLEGLKLHQQNLKNSLQQAPSISEAHSLVTLISDWWNGSKPGQIFSLGVYCSGHYGLTEGLFYCLPVKFQAGNWELVEDIEINDSQKEKIKSIEEELKREIAVIFPSIFKSNETFTHDVNNKVFGNENQSGSHDSEPGDGDGSGDKEGTADMSGPLTRIVEESESESKAGTRGVEQ